MFANTIPMLSLLHYPERQLNAPCGQVALKNGQTCLDVDNKEPAVVDFNPGLILWSGGPRQAFEHPMTPVSSILAGLIGVYRCPLLPEAGRSLKIFSRLMSTCKCCFACSLHASLC